MTSGSHRTFWTSDKIERLEALWAEGHSARVIAAEFSGATRNSVLGAVYREGLPKRTTHVYAVRTYSKRKPSTKRLYVPVKRREIICEPVAGPDASLRVSFDDLKKSHCRFPYGEKPYLFCGAQKLSGSSYCPHHHARVWVKPNYKKKTRHNFITRQVVAA